MRYNIETIKNIIEDKPETKIIYFWGHTPTPNKITPACFSQWFNCKFDVDNITYHTAEQYMMAQKALLFADDEIFDKIMEANHPHDYKKLGRQIRGFNDKLWNEFKFDIVVNGNKAKFSQNKDIKEYLISTGDAILVEASPYDKIWGIGLDRDTAMKGTVDDWKGENLLGCALMEVRDWLKEK